MFDENHSNFDWSARLQVLLKTLNDKQKEMMTVVSIYPSTADKALKSYLFIVNRYISVQKFLVSFVKHQKMNDFVTITEVCNFHQFICFHIVA